MRKFEPIRDDRETLFELMLTADRFCWVIRSKLEDQAPVDREELRLKLAQCISAVQQLRDLYECNRLTITDATVRAGVRQLVLSLMWATFYARDFIDLKAFRQVVMVEAAFSYLLASGDFGGSLRT